MINQIKKEIRILMHNDWMNRSLESRRDKNNRMIERTNQWKEKEDRMVDCMYWSWERRMIVCVDHKKE